PRVLRRREVRVEHEARDLAHAVLVPGLAQSPALLGGAAVLPHDRRSDRLERAPVPEHERLALVRDAGRDDVSLRRAGGVERLRRARLHGVPDLVRVVLDPTGPREVLRDLAIALAANLAVEPDGDRRGARRAFV